MVSQVSVIGSGKEQDLRQASIKFRLNRNPVPPCPAAPRLPWHSSSLVPLTRRRSYLLTDPCWFAVVAAAAAVALLLKLHSRLLQVIGDKFSSRHGQKGVLSQLWPDVDMPYCAATGMRCAPSPSAADFLSSSPGLPLPILCLFPASAAVHSSQALKRALSSAADTGLAWRHSAGIP